MSNNEIIIVTNERDGESGLRGFDDQVDKVVDKTVSTDKLQESYNNFMSSMRAILTNPENAQVGDFVLDEISFNAEISASGDFKLIGTGIGIEAGTGIAFKLRRKEA